MILFINYSSLPYITIYLMATKKGNIVPCASLPGHRRSRFRLRDFFIRRFSACAMASYLLWRLSVESWGCFMLKEEQVESRINAPAFSPSADCTRLLSACSGFEAATAGYSSFAIIRNRISSLQRKYTIWRSIFSYFYIIRPYNCTYKDYIWKNKTSTHILAISPHVLIQI